MKATEGQNILDIALQEYGTLDLLFYEIMIPNDLSINANLKGGQNITTNPNGKGNEKNKDYIKQRGLVLVNNRLTINENIQPAPVLQWPEPLNVSASVVLNANKVVQ